MIKKLIVFVFLSLFIYIVVAIPMPSRPFCIINAEILDIEKTRTNIEGRGYSQRKDFEYYEVILNILDIEEDAQNENLPCDMPYAESLEGAGAIIFVPDYQSKPISAGQKIRASINCYGDEWFSGCFLSNIQIVPLYNLSDFPNFIDKNSALLVVGDQASQLDIESGSDYLASASGLVNYTKCGGVEECIINLANSATIAAKNVQNIYKQDIISIGGPCANPITAEIMALPTTWPECANGFFDGKGRIVLFNRLNKTQLVIAGYKAEDTIMAAKLLERHQHRNLRGKELEISGESYKVVLSDEERYCSRDEDCVIAKDGCCGCNNYLAVNRIYDGMYTGNCKNFACAGHVCIAREYYTKCINNKCELI